jgi:hypothetical protein
VTDFLKLKGINLNRAEDYNMILASGIDVKNYFNKKEILN